MCVILCWEARVMDEGVPDVARPRGARVVLRGQSLGPCVERELPLVGVASRAGDEVQRKGAAPRVAAAKHVRLSRRVAVLSTAMRRLHGLQAQRTGRPLVDPGDTTAELLHGASEVILPPGHVT